MKKGAILCIIEKIVKAIWDEKQNSLAPALSPSAPVVFSLTGFLSL